MKGGDGDIHQGGVPENSGGGGSGDE